MSTPGRPAGAGTDETPRVTKMDTTVPLRDRINVIKAARRRELGRNTTTVETLEHVVAYYEQHHGE